MSEDVTLPDDPNHPHPWGRPFRVVPEEAIYAREMIKAVPPDWLTRALTRRVGRSEATQRFIDHGRPYDPAEEV